ncbi:roadblock/LC7 domain-containing protein [Dactylosporangium darangshiense]|uniref:Roadblock/LC7 domain-containing protein n=1 Tax=Dactylosporangium darangshiense TaxID=579108 RepID=A0ABP8DR47_9ACTN
MERDLTWLLEDLVHRVGGIDHAVVLSADGLVLTASTQLHRDGAEHLAAIASAVHSLAKGLSAQFPVGSPKQALLELEDAYFLVTAAGPRAYLAVLAGRDAELGMITYEMVTLVDRAGSFLAAAQREPVTTTP